MKYRELGKSGLRVSALSCIVKTRVESWLKLNLIKK